jgi:hypothetical protein
MSQQPSFSAKQLRLISRWVHIVGAIILGIYIYSPWSRYVAFSLFVKVVTIPILTLTGLAMWQQARTLNLLRRFLPTND